MSGCDKCLTLGVLAPCDEHAPPWRQPPATDRDAVLEEAARACEALEDKGWRTDDCIEAIRALKATPTPITPSAVDEAEQRGADRAIAQMVAWLRREADKFAKRAEDMTMASWRRRAFTSGASEYLDVATHIERGDHIPPATESEAGRG